MRALIALWWLISLGVLAFLLLPVLVVIPLSFSSGAFLSLPLPGLGLRWYRAFFASDAWLASLWNSLLIGGVAAAAATGLGTPAAIGLWLGRVPLRGPVIAILLTPLVVPAVVTGIALSFAFAPLGLANTRLGLMLAHTVLASPFVVVTVLASLSRFDPLLLRAAAASGAGAAATLRHVMLPLILPGVAAGFVFAFATSLEESVVVQFLAGPGQRTLPRQMFAGLKDSIELTILAAASMLVLASVLLMGATHLLRRRNS